MLHYAKVMQALVALQDDLFTDNALHISTAQASWQRLANDPTFAFKIREISSPWLLPTWQGAVDAVHQVDPLHEPYQVVSVDGSQIYPDRHQGTSCYLVNVGGVQLRYRQEPCVQFDSKPYVFAGRSEDEAKDSPMDVVNAKRQELELQTGLAWCTDLFEQSALPQAFLFDGSLVFWHLASYSTHLKDYYMSRYLGLMHELYAQQILHGGYISLPKSKELVNLIRVELCNFIIEGCTDYKMVDHIVDTTVAGFFLQPGQRTTVFKSNAIICKQYPPQLIPHFFYLHVGNETARVEIPAWIAQDEQKLQTVARIMYDQAVKGNGYPVALAEAHEQAVVKGPDREFFYQMLHKLAIEHRKQQHISQKSAKKRIIGI